MYATGGNDEGAAALGILPEGKDAMNTHEMLRAAALGDLHALWLVGADPIEQHPNPRLGEDALEGVPFLIYQGLRETPAMAYASVVLPMEAPAEQDGTYTNIEGRVQRMPKALGAPGDAKEAWRTYAEIMVRMNPGQPYFSPRDVMSEIAKKVAAFKDATYDKLPAEGRTLKPAMEEYLP